MRPGCAVPAMTTPLLPTGSRRADRSARRRLLAACFAALAAFALQAVADYIPIENADVRVEEDEVVLNADFALNLNATLE